MALFTNLALTDSGEKMVNDYLTGAEKTPIAVTAIAIGDGAKPDNLPAQKALVHEVRRLAVETTQLDNGELTVTARLSTDSLTEDVRHRELGVYSGDTLFAYAHAGDEYDVIPAAGQNTAVIKQITVRIVVGTVDIRLETLKTDDYVTYAGLEQRVNDRVGEVVPEEVQRVFDENLPGAINDKIDELLPDKTDEALKEQLPKVLPEELGKQLPAAVESEVHGLIDSGRFGEIVHEEVVQESHSDDIVNRSTPKASDTQSALAITLAEQHSADGRLDHITVDVRATEAVTQPLYLALWELSADGKWEYAGTSHNALSVHEASMAKYIFRGVKVHARALRMAFVASQNLTEWNVQTFTPVLVGCSASAVGNVAYGDAITPPGGEPDVYKIVTLTMGTCASIYAKQESLDAHAADAVKHITQPERDAWNAKPTQEQLADELSDKVTDRELHYALTKDSLTVVTTPAPNSNYECIGVYLAATYIPAGKLLRKIAVKNRTTNGHQSSQACYLQVQEQVADGDDFATIAVSQNAVAHVAGGTSEWDFADELLSGRTIRMRLVSDPANRDWDMETMTQNDYLVWGTSVAARTAGDKESGMIISPHLLVEKKPFVPGITLTVTERVEKYAPIEHVEDADAHMQDGDRAKWDAAVEGLAAHKEDGVAHVNAQDRANWDSKATKQDVQDAKTALQEEIRSSMSSVLSWRGSVATVADLPQEGQQKGDVYDVQETGSNYAWTGEAWDDLGPALTGLVKAQDFEKFKDETTAALTKKAEADALLAHTGDDSLHVTQPEKENWNNKYTREEVDGMIGGFASAEALQSHMDDTEAHVTQDEKDGWNNHYTREEVDRKVNGFADAQTLTDHVNDTTAHLTQAERDTLADKYTREEVNGMIGGFAQEVDLNTHIQDKVAHVTQPEKDKWNAKLEASALTGTDSVDVAELCEEIGTVQFNGVYVGAPYVPQGRLLSVDLPCRAEGDFTGSTVPVYLNILRFTEGETQLEFLACSTDAPTPALGETLHWDFSDQEIYLDGGAIALYLGMQPNAAQLQLKFDAPVHKAIDERSAILVENASKKQTHTLPALKISVQRSIGATPQELREHALDPSPHMTAEEHSALAELIAGGGGGGTPGPYFTPSVSADGLLSWTNNGGLENPASVNIKGADGAPGKDGKNGADGAPGAQGPAGPAGQDAELTAEQSEALQFVQENQDGLQGLLDGGGGGLSDEDKRKLASMYVRSNSTVGISWGSGIWEESEHSVCLVSNLYGSRAVSINNASATYDDSVVIGYFAKDWHLQGINGGGYSVAVGNSAEAVAGCVAVGQWACAAGNYSTAIGYEAYTDEEGVVVLKAGKNTQLYLVASGSKLARTYTNGDAALGFVVFDAETKSAQEFGIVSLPKLFAYLKTVVPDAMSTLNFSPNLIRKYEQYDTYTPNNYHPAE